MKVFVSVYICIFSHNQVTYSITAIDRSLNYIKRAIWADTDTVSCVW